MKAGETVGHDDALMKDALPTANIVTKSRKMTKQFFAREGQTWSVA